MTTSPGERRLRRLTVGDGEPDERARATRSNASSDLSDGERRLEAMLGGRSDAADDAGASVHRSLRDPSKPVYVISVAAELAGMHAQTLRQYDRLGLVTPERTRGGGRRYSMRDIDLLRQVQELSAEGVSLAGIQRIMELENRVDALTARVGELTEENTRYREALDLQARRRIFSAGRDGIVALRPGERPSARSSGTSLVLYRPRG